MTILPAKKKREKEPSQKSSTSGVDNSSRPPSSQSASGSKRTRAPEDGPPNKRWIMSPAAQFVPSPLSSPRSSSFPGSSEEKKNARSSPGGDCNSDDEYHLQDVRDEEVEADFVRRLMARGLVIKEMVGDGACMFRAIAEQVYGDQEMHGQIRSLCMDYMMNNKDHFKEFITENYENYIQRKREENCHGNHVELQAISEMFARPVEVYQYSDVPINVLLPRPEPVVAPGEGTSSSSNAAAPQVQQNPPLRLSYHGAVHYNAILQPNVATIGVGLGLPGMVPGAADKDLMNRAMATSELEHIEEAMLQDKIDMTDYQRTQADIEDQIAQESLMSYLKDMEKSASGAPEEEQGPSTSAPSTSSAAPPVEESSAPIGLYEEMLAAQSLDWDDDMAMAGAMLLSQQDYLSNKPGPSNSGGPSSSGGSD